MSHRPTEEAMAKAEAKPNTERPQRIELRDSALEEAALWCENNLYIDGYVLRRRIDHIAVNSLFIADGIRSLKTIVWPEE